MKTFRTRQKRLRPQLVAWLLLIILVVVLALRPRDPEVGPSVTLVLPDGQTREVSLVSIEEHPSLSRLGEYQNQYGTWRDRGVYTGVRLTDLIGADAHYESIRVVAADGYEFTIERARVEDPAFPVVLAYALDGLSVPDWADGYRIAVLPESGRVGNEEYGADSAGSYWVKNVERIVVQQATQ